MAESNNIVRPRGVAVHRRNYGVFRWGLLLSLVLVTLASIVLALVLVLGGDNTVPLLAALICTLLAVGVISCVFLQWLHRRAMRRRDEGAKAWINRTLSENQLELAPELPPQPEPSAPALTPRTSWVHWMPWRKSGPPTRNTGTPSSRSTGPPSYSMVGRNGRSS
ncbi:uncharacterized protein [Periplaneta americana]|uniref:uncharacterized protein n=1 Tax=Periplaneta americana TaxID=6978 RepID=UPI0037E8A1B7